MSVWTDISGTISTRKDSNFSVKTHIDDYFDHVCALDYSKPSVRTENSADHYITHFTFSICDYGVQAAEVIQDIVNALPDNAIADVTATVRFLK